MEDDLNFLKKEDDLNVLKMEDDLIFLSNKILKNYRKKMQPETLKIKKMVVAPLRVT